jgi:signal transduction histidine kinase
MAPSRRNLLIALAGAACGAGATLAWSEHPEYLAPVLLGAAFGTARRWPRATWLFAVAVTVVTGAFGSVPGGDGVVSTLMISAHAFAAGRLDPRWYAVPALLAGTAVGWGLMGRVEGMFLFAIPAAWAAGRMVRERELVAVELERRNRELEEEREAYAQLSVRYERAKIASELHDIVAHAISVMVVQASAGQRIARVDAAATGEVFEAIAGAAREAEQDMQRLVALLGDEDVGSARDLTLIDELVARASRTGLNVSLRVEGDCADLDPAVAQVAFRVIQEGLTNALRYAASAPVSACVRGEADALVVEISNGRAERDAVLAGTGTGNGLIGLSERVGARGGTVESGPTLAGGWRLIARVPRKTPSLSTT